MYEDFLIHSLLQTLGVFLEFLPFIAGFPAAWLTVSLHAQDASGYRRVTRAPWP